MTAKQIRAGDAFIELRLRDKKAKEDLKRFQQRMAAFATGVKVVGAAFSAAGGGITAVMAKSVHTFMEVSEHAKKTGLAIAGIDPSKAERLSAAWNTFKATLGAIQFFVGSALAEPLTKVLHVLTSLTVQLAKFIRDNQTLVVVVGAVGAGLLAAGVAIAAFGAALGTSAGLAVAIIAGIGATLVTVSGLFVSFSDIAKESLAGIAAAVLNGDFAGAFLIVFNAIHAAWIGVVEGMKLALLNAMSFIITQLKATLAKVSTIVTVIGIGVEKLGGGSGIRDLGGTLTKGIGLLNSGQSVIDAAIPVQRQKLGKEFAEALARITTGTAAQKDALRLRLKGIGSFADLVGGSSQLFGSSQGTFSGAAASLFGVGPGGGQKVSDDKSHQLQERIIKAINGLELGETFK